MGKGKNIRAYELEGRSQAYLGKIKEHGFKDIKTTFLPMESEDKSYLEEVRFIAYFKALGCKLVNKTGGGQGLKLLDCTLEVRLKMSLAKKGKPSKKKGKPLTEDHKRNLSLATKGKKRGPHTAVHKQNLSISNKGKPHRLTTPPWNKGKKFAPDAPNKPGVRKGTPSPLRGIPFSLERCENISKAKKGKPSPKKGKPSPLKGRKHTRPSPMKGRKVAPDVIEKRILTRKRNRLKSPAYANS